MPQLLIRLENETKRLRRPAPVGNAQRMADIVPSRVTAEDPEEALGAGQAQVIPAKINGHLRVDQVNGVRIYPSSIKQQREYRERFLWCVDAPAPVVCPHIARVAYTACFLPGSENKDIWSTNHKAGVIVVRTPAFRALIETVLHHT